MTKKDYKLIAETLYKFRACLSVRDYEDMCYEFQRALKVNPNFNADKFLNACMENVE